MFKLSVKSALFLLSYAVPNALLSLEIIYIINGVMGSKEQFFSDEMAIAFLATVVYAYLLNIIFQRKINRYSFEVLYKNERNIFERVLKSSFSDFERIGPQRIYICIEDLRVFSTFPEVITRTVNSVMMLIVCLAYFFFISVPAASIVVFLVSMFIGVYFLVIRVLSPKIDLLRNYNQDYYKYVGDLIKGFKDFKVSSLRRTNLISGHLVPNREEAKKLDISLNFTFLFIGLISQYGLYLIIGVSIFALPKLELAERSDMTTYVILLLFISGPISMLINMQNFYAKMSVSNSRIKIFLKDLNSHEIIPEANEVFNDAFSSLTFENVVFSHSQSACENDFVLGPINFSVQKGETIFIVGGNGSGKSTFVNILTGLYSPSAGNILLNGEHVHTSAPMQNLISAIFTDNHLSSYAYNNYAADQNAKYREWLRVMQLESVAIDDVSLSPSQAYSKGQSKRLALILALLENKPIIVLDEWAAEQDPSFRRYFYEDIVPELKRSGKTIVAITHDDAFFNYADRIIKFDYGNISMDIKVKALESSAPIWK